ncbi:MAG TPA: helix-turn-helix transcriptional regulator [Afipia sp.]
MEPIDFPVRLSRLAFEEELENIPRPIVVRGQDYDTGFRTQAHVHGRSQLIFAAAGAITVFSQNRVWAVPTHRAIWVPAGVEHTSRSCNEIKVRSIFVDPAYVQLRECCAVSVTPLLRELIMHAVELPQLYPLGGAEDRFMHVLLDQLEGAPSAPLYLPLPKDSRLKRVALTFLEQPACNKHISRWCEEIGLSERTFSRMFPAETGMSFRQWQQMARILDSIRRLGCGESITRVSEEVGYANPSAFIAVFRRVTGTTPHQYLKQQSAMN